MKVNVTPSLHDLLSLKNKRALVVGGTGILGSEIVKGLAELGADIVIASRNYENCIKYSHSIKECYPNIRVEACQIDICSSNSIKEAFKFIQSIYSDQLDILVNCGWSGKKNTFESISELDWNNDIEVNLNGVFKTIREAFPSLKLSKGCILNIASMYGHIAPDYKLYESSTLANPPSYGAAKAGIIQLTKYLASFLSPYQIRVNCISPGPFPYVSTQNEYPDFIKKLSSKNPMNRIGQPYEIKGVAALLCSEAGSYITGQNLCVDGGWGIW